MAAILEPIGTEQYIPITEALSPLKEKVMGVRCRIRTSSVLEPDQEAWNPGERGQMDIGLRIIGG
jgi:hypothetical protein